MKFFIHYPLDWKPTNKRAAIVFFFGGGWQEATLRQTDVFLTSLGYLKGEPTLKIPGESRTELKREK